MTQATESEIARVARGWSGKLQTFESVGFGGSMSFQLPEAQDSRALYEDGEELGDLADVVLERYADAQLLGLPTSEPAALNLPSWQWEFEGRRYPVTARLVRGQHDDPEVSSVVFELAEDQFFIMGGEHMNAGYLVAEVSFPAAVVAGL